MHCTHALCKEQRVCQRIVALENKIFTENSDISIIITQTTDRLIHMSCTFEMCLSENQGKKAGQNTYKLYIHALVCTGHTDRHWEVRVCLVVVEHVSNELVEHGEERVESTKASEVHDVVQVLSILQRPHY